MDRSSEYCPGLKVRRRHSQALTGGLMGPERVQAQHTVLHVHTPSSPSWGPGNGLPTGMGQDEGSQILAQIRESEGEVHVNSVFVCIP